MACRIWNKGVSAMRGGGPVQLPQELSGRLLGHGEQIVIAGTPAAAAALFEGGAVPAGLRLDDVADALINAPVRRPDHLPSILDRDLATPPAMPALGSRYIVRATGLAAWAGHDNEIAEWNGTAWRFTVPTIGCGLFVEDELISIHWNGTLWSGHGLHLFRSGIRTATGAEETIAHGLGITPTLVFPVILAGHNGAGAGGTQVPTVTEGAHTATNVLITLSAGTSYRVVALP